jgi:hypothetical protein
MIDEKMLFNRETIAREIGHTLDAAIVRLARRYLALRKNGVMIYPNLDGICHEDSLDAAADRLLERSSSQAQNMQAQNGDGSE